MEEPFEVKVAKSENHQYNDDYDDDDGGGGGGGGDDDDDDDDDENDNVHMKTLSLLQ